MLVSTPIPNPVNTRNTISIARLTDAACRAAPMNTMRDAVRTLRRRPTRSLKTEERIDPMNAVRDLGSLVEVREYTLTSDFVDGDGGSEEGRIAYETWKDFKEMFRANESTHDAFKS